MIKFYRVKDDYGWMSNFAKYSIQIDMKMWPTVEHYFQAQKFPDNPEYQELIRKQKSAMTSAQMGRDRNYPLRADWEEVKDSIMLKALRAKINQHPELLLALKETGDEELVEHTSNDNYWGDGGDGSGKNMLGKLLMQIRADI